MAELKNKAVNLEVLKEAYKDLDTKKANKTDISVPYKFRGNCTFASLPTSGNEINDTFYVTDKKCKYSWNGTNWYQSSLNETDYLDEFDAFKNEVDNKVSELKSDLADITVRKKSSNLFNQDTITDGMLFNPNGVLISESNFITTDFIPVNSGETLYFSIKPREGFTERYAYNIFRLFFFTVEKEIIAQAYDTVKSVVVPDGAYYVRVSVNKKGLNDKGIDQEFAINIGGIVEDYEPYYDYKSLKCDEVLSEESENPVQNKVVTVELNKGKNRIDELLDVIDEISVVEEPNNLFDQNATEPGELRYGSSGTVDETITTHITSGYINAKPGKTVYFSRQDYGETYRTAVKCYVCCYDNQKNPVTNRVDGVSNYVIPDNAAFFRISVSNTSASEDKLFAINYDEVKPYEVYSAPIIVSNDHDTVVDNDRYIKSFAKTARNTDYTKIVKTCTHVSRRPLVTIVADDGWANDYIKLMDMVDKVHETYPDANIPCCISLQTNAVHLPNGMTLEQALYSQNELGWEYACHVDGTNLENLATENEIEDLIVSSLKLYDLYGLNVQNIVYCEGGNDERVRRIAKKYFNCGATTLPWYGGEDTTSDNTGIIGSMYLKRHGLGIYPSGDGTFENDYKVAVDNAIAHNGWLIFMLHPNSAEHDETQQQYFIQTIKYCIEQGVDIVTLQQGYDIFGNVLECGDFLGSTSAYPEQGFAISKNGEFSKNPFI